MAIQAEVQKNEQENDVNLIRRFQKRVQGAGIIQTLRKRRYHSRLKSRNVRRAGALKVIARREVVQGLIKLGKMPERPVRGRGRK